MLSTVLLMTAALMQSADAPAPAPDNTPSPEGIEQFVEDAVMSHTHWQLRELAEKAIALGPAIKGDAEKYLSHPDIGRRQCAFYLLSHVPELAPDAILHALRSDDQALRPFALNAAGPYLGDPNMSDAWLEAFAEWLVDPAFGNPEASVLLDAPESIRSNVAVDWVSRVTGLLDQATIGSATLTIYMLGELAEPGKSDVIDMITGVHHKFETRFLAEAEPIIDEVEWRQFDSAAAVALVNLNAKGAIADYELEILEGTADQRLERLAQLPKLRPRSDVLMMGVRLLDCRLDGFYRGVSHAPAPEPPNARVCDAVMYACARWIDEFPVTVVGRARIHSQDDLDTAKAWLIEYIVGLNESQLPASRGRDNAMREKQ